MLFINKKSINYIKIIDIQKSTHYFYVEHDGKIYEYFTSIFDKIPKIHTEVPINHTLIDDVLYIKPTLIIYVDKSEQTKYFDTVEDIYKWLKKNRIDINQYLQID